MTNEAFLVAPMVENLPAVLEIWWQMKKFCRSSAQLDAWSVLAHITMVAFLGGSHLRETSLGQQVRQAVKNIFWSENSADIHYSSETRGHVNRVSTCLLLGSLHDKGPEKICNWGQDPHGREEGLAGRRAEGLFTWRWKKTTNRYHGLLIGGGLQVTTGYNFYPSRKLHSCESAGTTCGPVPQPLLLVSSSSLSVLSCQHTSASQPLCGHCRKGFYETQYSQI